MRQESEEKRQTLAARATNFQFAMKFSGGTLAEGL
jgi:hypothetical protein